MSSEERTEYKWRVGFSVLVFVLLWLLWRGAHLVLLTFAGVLLGIFFGAIANCISNWTRVRYLPAVVITLLLCLAVIALAGWFIIPSLSKQLTDLASQLPEAWNNFLGNLKERGILQDARQLTGQTGSGDFPETKKLLEWSRTFFAGLAGFVGGFLIVLFVGIYAAGDPGVYRRGVLQLFSPKHRERAAGLVDKLHGTLKHWIVGQAVSMTAVGVLTAVGLWAIGAPLPLALGLIAGLFELIPRFGPFLAAIPAVLLGFSESTSTALWIAALYLGIQLFESYVLLPMVQRRAVHVPPILSIFALTLFGTVFGFIGVLVAVPFTAMILVLVQELYVNRSPGVVGPEGERRGV